mgnify:CR=1 FL=1
MLASRKLGRKDAAEIAKRASAVFVAKGKRVSAFKPAGSAGKELLDGMLGRTGNLRAPTMRVGKITVVGFNDEAFQAVLG